MDYIDRNLRNGEIVVTKVKISFLYILPRLLWLAIALAAVIALSMTVLKINTESVESIPYTPDFVSTPTLPQEAQTYEKLFKISRIILWVFFGLTACIPFITRIIVIFTTHLVITNKRVIGKQGVLKILTIDIPIDKIDNVSFNAGIFGNLFKYYNVSIKSTGGDGWLFHAVSNAQAFKDSANDAIEQHAEQARKDQASQIAMAMNSKIID